MFKLKQNDISGNLWMILQDYLDEQKDRVELNRQIFHGRMLPLEFPYFSPWPNVLFHLN